jgi:hypothetical protein
LENSRQQGHRARDRGASDHKRQLELARGYTLEALARVLDPIFPRKIQGGVQGVQVGAVATNGGPGTNPIISQVRVNCGSYQSGSGFNVHLSL